MHAECIRINIHRRVYLVHFRFDGCHIGFSTPVQELRDHCSLRRYTRLKGSIVRQISSFRFICVYNNAAVSHIHA